MRNGRWPTYLRLLHPALETSYCRTLGSVLDPEPRIVHGALIETNGLPASFAFYTDCGDLSSPNIAFDQCLSLSFVHHVTLSGPLVFVPCRRSRRAPSLFLDMESASDSSLFLRRLCHSATGTRSLNYYRYQLLDDIPAVFPTLVHIK
jgi:hypothetical protein